ncbi:MAG: GH25 family lysozyme [Flavobacteriales bacterium]|nr:glycoside hydrolase family 25 protein [Flavobacteriales bacterium]
MIRAALQWLILIGLLGALCVLLVYFGFLRANYPSKSRFPIRGIDISHHQNAIDWDKVKEEKFSFVFIKATEGVDYVDPNFEMNRKEAVRTGHKVGAYHFYLICRPGLEQAEHFIRQVDQSSIDLPPVIDLEFVAYCEERPPQQETLDEIQVCIDHMHDHYGKEPILYVTDDFYSNYVKGRFPNNPIWIRDIINEPELEKGRVWKFWQYTNRGRVNGIEGYVDLNVFNGDQDAFDPFMSKITLSDRVEEKLIVGDYLFVAEHENVASCDTALYVLTNTITPLARTIANDEPFDLQNDSVSLALLDSMLSGHDVATRKFYFWIVTKSLKRSDGYYSEGVGFWGTEFLISRPQEFLEAWQNCITQVQQRTWAWYLAAEEHIGSEGYASDLVLADLSHRIDSVTAELPLLLQESKKLLLQQIDPAYRELAKNDKPRSPVNP